MSKKDTVIDAATKKKISAILQAKLDELSKSLSDHDERTSKELPKNSKEALSIKGEIEILEALEKHESTGILSIKNALQKLNSDDFGICMGCRGSIGVERLLVRPWSTLCVPCKEKKEAK